MHALLIPAMSGATTFLPGFTSIAMPTARAIGISAFAGFGFTGGFFASMFRMLTHF
jgi:hypothetical protein